MEVIPNSVNEQTADAVNLNNIKSIGELHAVTASLAAQNQLANQHRVNEMSSSVLANSMNAAQQMSQLAAQQALSISASQAQLQQAITGRVARFMLDTSGEEAVAFNKQIGADLQDQVSKIGGALASVQEMAKISQTTPPQTGTGGAFGSDSGSALTQQLSNLAASISAIQSMLASGGKA